MSKSVKTILSVAAVVAIPLAAPALAGSAFFAPMAAKMGAAGIGTIGQSAILGAAMGAGKSAIFGEDIGKGAAFGALGGGLGGYSAARATEAANAANAAAAPAGLAAPAGPMTTAPWAETHAWMQPGAAGPAGAGLVASSAGTTTQLADQGLTFTEALKKVPEQIAAQFKDPKALADLTLRAAGMLVGSAASLQGLSDQEQALVKAQAQDLKQQQQQNAEVFRARLDEAQKLIGESAYFDPEYFGLQGARQAQQAGDQAKRAGLQGMTGDRRAVAQRQYDLGTARNTGTAYDSGYQKAIGARLQTRAAGLAAFPGAYPSTSGDFNSLMAAYGGGEAIKRQKRESIGEFMDPVLNPGREEKLQDDEERGA